MSSTLIFAPLLPLWALIACGAIAMGLIILRAVAARRGVVFRLAALAALLVLLANPLLVKETRTPVPDVAVIVTDTSESQDVKDRAERSRRAADTLAKRLASEPGLEVRRLALGRGEDGTEIFGPLADAMADIPANQFAGLVLITDGIVHDTPASASALTHGAPLHFLLTGRRDEADRKLTILRAPVYGIVGDTVDFSLRVDDEGGRATAEPRSAAITIAVDGKTVATHQVVLGREETLPIRIAHGGHNIVEITAEPGPSELTLVNNRAVVTTNGVRDRLRVLLVTGEPHAGERTWRDLLKADPSVDLVHFTILRPPEKQDGTPIDELSLIAFPTRDLFEEKLDDFNLVIFDRYQRRGVLPIGYLNNVASYVERGGALLDAAGPAFATFLSLYHTPLAAVLPAQPTGEIVEAPFRVRVTERGERHPVTAGLPGANAAGSSTEPGWGRWFRLLDANARTGETLLSGPNDRPALVLDRVGQGRVAQVLSDQGWLWARGFDGGGPQAELLRRLAHWLMKEPDLEEEMLSGEVVKRELIVRRRTMADQPQPVTVTKPDGRTQTLTLDVKGSGQWQAALPADAQGLYKLDDGTLTALAAVGPLNPREFQDLRTDANRLKPLVMETGGTTIWLPELRADSPTVRRVVPGRMAGGRDWIGFRANHAYSVSETSHRPLFPPLLALFLAGGLLGLAWYRESR